MNKDKTIFICNEQGISLGQLKQNKVYVYVAEAGEFYNTEETQLEQPMADFQKEAAKIFRKFFHRPMKKQLTKK